MARLRTLGFESGISSTTRNYNGETNNAVAGEGAQNGNTVSYQSAVARNGGQALQCGPGANNYVQLDGPAFTANVGYYVRFYLRFDAAPSQDCIVWMWRLNAVDACDVVINSSRQLVLRGKGGSIIGTSAALAVNTWYRVEALVIVPAAGNGAASLFLDGVEVVTSLSVDVGTDLTPATHRVGHQTAAESQMTLYIDDLAINDSTGSDNTLWPGPGNVTLLKPTGDNATGTGWEGPQTTGSDTTNLYDNVDNVPPTGVAHSDVDANAGKYVFNAANLGAASEYRASCQSMSDAGIPSGSVVTLSQAYMRASCDSTTGTNNMELQGITPSDAAVTCNVETTAVAGTEPTGWKSFRTAYTNAPSLTYTTNPVVEATKILTGATRAHMVDQMGLLIEWRPPVEANAALSGTGTLASAGTTVRSTGAALSGSGTLATAGARLLTGSATLSGSGNLEAAGNRATTASAPLSGSGSLTAAGARTAVGVASLAGSGTLTAAGTASHATGAALSGTAALSAAGTHTASTAAALTGSGALASTGTHTAPGSASLAGTGSLSAAGHIIGQTAASLSGTGALASSGVRKTYADASLQGSGALASAGVRIVRTGATFSGTGTLATAGMAAARASAALSGSGLLTATAIQFAYAEAELTGSGTMLAVGRLIAAHPLKEVVMTLSSGGASLSLSSVNGVAVGVSSTAGLAIEADDAEIDTETATELEVTYG